MIAAILLAVPLTGCMQDTGDGDGSGPGQATVQVAWKERPEDMKTGEPIAMTWELTGPDREIQHTGVHFANFSVEDPETPADYGNSSGIREPAQVPDTYDTTVTFNESGTYYFRAHAIVDGQHKWTPEVAVNVTQKGPISTPVSVSVESAPDEATAGEAFNVSWRVTGTPSQVRTTSVYYGNASVENPAAGAKYAERTGVHENASIPQTFTTNVTVNRTGALYLRAHAVHEGSHYWSDEVQVNLTAGNDTGDAGAPTNVSVEIHDDSALGLNPSLDPQNVTVLQNGTVTWENRGNVSYTIDFANDSLEDSPSIPAGENWTWNVSSDLEPAKYEYSAESQTASASGSVTVKAEG